MLYSPGLAPFNVIIFLQFQRSLKIIIYVCYFLFFIYLAEFSKPPTTGFEPACLTTQVFETSERPDCSTSAQENKRNLSFKIFVKYMAEKKIQKTQKKRPG